MATIKILIADDHAILREGLKMVLGLEEDLQVIGEAASGREAIQQAAALRPDLVLMDVLMDDTNGIDACWRETAASAAPHYRSANRGRRLARRSRGDAGNEAGPFGFL